MVTRRSARLRSSNETPDKGPKSPFSALKFSSILEREASPQTFNRFLSAITSPKSSPTRRSPAQSICNTPAEACRTPSSSGLYPSLDEMHPSKVHQSTAKQPDSGLRHGFLDVVPKTEPAYEGRIRIVNTQDTPSKNKTATESTAPPSAAADFRSARPGTGLSAEAQKLMNDLREEALSIKAKLAAEREKATRSSVELGVEKSQNHGMRKLATAKGRVGRYSAVHMEEFKKMDSIAGHPSAFRNQTTKIAVVHPAASTHSLKRTLSKAKFDDTGSSRRQKLPKGSSSVTASSDPVEAPLSSPKSTKATINVPAAGNALARTKSFKKIAMPPPPRQVLETQLSTPGAGKPKSSLPVFTITPSAGISRSPSLKHPQTAVQVSKIPRSPSTRSLNPGLPRSESSSKYLSGLATLGKMKAALRKPQTEVSTGEKLRAAAVSTGAISPFASPKVKPNLNKELPPLPPDGQSAIPRSPSMRDGKFAPTIISRLPVSPSPRRLLSAVSAVKSGNPCISFPYFPRPTTGGSEVVGRGVFTFRAEKELKFKDLPKHNSSTGKGATIRHIVPQDDEGGRQDKKPDISDLPSVPHGIPNKKHAREEPPTQNQKNGMETLSTGIKTIPHGITNKKRRRSATVDSEEENREPASKKQRSWKPSKASKPQPAPADATTTGETKPIGVVNLIKKHTGGLKTGKPTTTSGVRPAQKGRGILSFSRLNALAKPKERK